VTLSLEFPLKLLAITTMVLVQDMDRALRFYRDVLGLTLQEEAEDWAMFAERVGLMLSPEPLPLDNLNLNAITLSLSVEDANAAYAELIQKGVAFLVPPTDVGGAIVASFRDSEGNLLQLIQNNLANEAVI
jgi:predicted enzyme related to lactoylglutathione lyase